MEAKFSGSVKVLIILASVVIVLAGIKTASAIVVPFLLSLFIAMACTPIIQLATRYRIPKGISVLLVIAIIVVLGFMLAGLVGQSMNEFSERMPEYRLQIEQKFLVLAEQLAEFNISLDKQQLISYLDPSVAMGMATNLLSSLGGVLGNFLLILLTVIFMLFEADSIPKKIHFALDDPQMKMQRVDKVLLSVKNYLAIKTMVSMFTGLLVGAWLYFLGLDHFLLWGVLAFLFNFIPNIGSIIAAVPAVLLAMLQLSLPEAGLVALGYVVVNTVMGNLVEPRYMGKGLGLSTLVVFLSLIFWGWLLGTVGMLLSVPLTMIVKIMTESREETHWLALLLSDENSLNNLPSQRSADS